MSKNYYQKHNKCQSTPAVARLPFDPWWRENEQRVRLLEHLLLDYARQARRHLPMDRRNDGGNNPGDDDDQDTHEQDGKGRDDKVNDSARSDSKGKQSESEASASKGRHSQMKASAGCKPVQDINAGRRWRDDDKDGAKQVVAQSAAISPLDVRALRELLQLIELSIDIHDSTKLVPAQPLSIPVMNVHQIRIPLIHVGPDLSFRVQRLRASDNQEHHRLDIPANPDARAVIPVNGQQIDIGPRQNAGYHRRLEDKCNRGNVKPGVPRTRRASMPDVHSSDIDRVPAMPRRASAPGLMFFQEPNSGPRRSGTWPQTRTEAARSA